MGSQDLLGQQFEAHRSRLRGIAYRMLGSEAEADDVVQETWLRLSRSDSHDVRNLAGWLTTVTTHICLDLLRSRAVRREDPLAAPERATGGRDEAADPQQILEIADDIGLALLVVLDRLTPAERVAFVLHDVFAMSFVEIGPVVGRSPTAARKLASRARQSLRGATLPDARLPDRQRVAEAFLAATRHGDVDALLAVLDRDVVRRADRHAIPDGEARVLRGAREVAEGTLRYSRTARRFARVALVAGSPGVVVVVDGRLRLALWLAVVDGRITEIDVVGDPGRLARWTIAW